MRWDTFFVTFKIVCFFSLGLVPDSTPVQSCQISINFIASMQYNTFMQSRKVPMTTTFCTNHLRQVGIDLVKWLHKGDFVAKERLFMHLYMILAFVAGAIVSTFLSLRFGGKAIWLVEILLLLVFIDLLRADLSY